MLLGHDPFEIAYQCGRFATVFSHPSGGGGGGGGVVVGEEAPCLANTNYSSMTIDGRSKSESHSSGQPDLFQG